MVALARLLAGLQPRDRGALVVPGPACDISCCSDDFSADGGSPTQSIRTPSAAERKDLLALRAAARASGNGMLQDI